MNDKSRQVAVMVTAVIQVVINTLIGTGIIDFGLSSTSAISDSLPNYFTPAGYTFLVWNVIFLGVLVYSFYQWRGDQAERDVHRRIGWWAVAANIGNGAWPLIWGAGGAKGTDGFQPGLHLISGFIIVGILFCLAMIFARLRDMHTDLGLLDGWFIQAPYSAFFAWINIATIANVTAILVSLGVEAGDAGAYWSVAMLVVATALGSGLILYSRGLVSTVAFTGILVWAFIGVAMGNGEQSGIVGITAVIAAVIVVLVTVFSFTGLYSQRELVSIQSST
jgi:hypothetical protein